jgi:hypothetical protein
VVNVDVVLWSLGGVAQLSTIGFDGIGDDRVGVKFKEQSQWERDDWHCASSNLTVRPEAPSGKLECEQEQHHRHCGSTSNPFHVAFRVKKLYNAPTLISSICETTDNVEIG